MPETYDELKQEALALGTRLRERLPMTPEAVSLLAIMHHRFGNMALAFALQSIETSDTAQLTNYGEFLELHPPQHAVQIVENSSWSCAHGVERWRDDCGCTSGTHAGRHQRWRKPLREALDWLRDELSPLFEREAWNYFAEPWRARNDYVEVILDRSNGAIDHFLERVAPRPLQRAVRARSRMW